MTLPSTSQYVRGALYGIAAVSIWAGWIVVARLGLRSSLNPWDIAALRFAVAGLIVLPFLLRKGLALERLGWIGFAAIVLGGGAPMVLLSVAGLMFAPAAHAGALFPGVMPLMVALLAAVVLKEQFSSTKRIGLILILAGVLAIVALAGATVGTTQNIGHLLFLGAAFLWACYTVAMRRARLEGLHAAAIAAVVSMLVYIPLYALFLNSNLSEAPWREIALQGFVQGILTAVLSLMLFGRAVALLGASSGAAFGALCPALTALLAIPVLGEWPTLLEWSGIVLISFGVYFVSGGPVPWQTEGRNQTPTFLRKPPAP
jgi:drug/metabolite transporter (DMT)-like permease